MPNFAIVEDGVVINTVLADSKAIAEEVTGKTCIAFTAANPAEPGGTYANNKFTKRKPYPSWVTDGDYGWQAPVAYPEPQGDGTGLYTWDESKLDWVATV